MKKQFLFLFVLLACSFNLFAGHNLDILSNKIPGALGDYLKVSDAPIEYRVSKPDVNGNVNIAITLTFDVVGCNSQIGLFEIKGHVLSYTNNTLLNFDAEYTDIPHQKVNHNPLVGEQLAKAIKSYKTKSITVTFNKTCTLEEALRFEKEAKFVVFLQSRIKR